MTEAVAPGPLSALLRGPTLNELATREFDVVVIGGGITGAGVARDAALRGLSVALLEADDFAVGTSSRSTKLIHGGLRYLAMGEIGLVRETALERKAVHQLAPHLAEPHWMLLPARSRLGLLKFRFGISLYEKLGAVVRGDRHQNWHSEALAQHEPCLDRAQFPHGCAYREYLTDDARLVLATLRSAAQADAVICNQLPAESLLYRGDQVCGVRARCRFSGEEITVQARAVVNAAGPWADQVATLEAPQRDDRLHLSLGVHAVVPASRLPLRNLVMLGADDGRFVFAVPRGETVFLGTTDTSYTGRNRQWPEIKREDVDYLLATANQHFDIAPLGSGDVVAAWAGLRPLIAEPGKAPKEMSRKEEVWVGPGGMVTVAGGKLTGFRRMAEQVMAVVSEQLQQTLPPPPGLAPLPGGDFDGDAGQLASRLAAKSGLNAKVAARLARLYGTEAHDVLALGATPLVEDGQMRTGEVEWAVEVEGAQSLEDLLYRRSRSAWYTPEERDALLVPAAERMAHCLGWDASEQQRQIEVVRAQYRAELGFREQ